MPLNDSGRGAALLGGLTNVVTHISLHSAIPNSSGSNELVGGTYARQSATWSAPAAGSSSNNGAMVHNVPAGSSVVAYGLWSASSGGTFYGWLPINGLIQGYGEVDAGDVTADTITSSGHGLVTDSRVFVRTVLSESIPAGLTVDTLYFVRNTVTTDTFQVALTSGGSAIAITGQGELYFQSCVPEVFGSSGTVTTAAGVLVLTVQ